MTHRVRTDITDGIAEVTLDRPEKHNALDGPMIDALVGAARRLGKNRKVRAVVLRGEGPSFCSGLDFPSAMRDPLFIPRMFLKLPLARMNKVQRVAIAWRDLPVPVIAAVHGNCFGGGLQVALGADFRFAHPDTRMGLLEVKYGLVPDMGGIAALRQQVRTDVLKELAMTGDTVDGARALEVGLVTRVEDDPLQAAHVFAQRLAERSPDAVSTAKQLINDSLHGSLRTVLRRERWAQWRVLGRANQRTAMKKRTDKAARFSPRSRW
jgi:enoyl-CoA hydratase/carnithine racemase